MSLAAGETSKPHKSVPRAIKATFFRSVWFIHFRNKLWKSFNDFFSGESWIDRRILLFYIMTIFVIGLNINHNNDTLFTADSDSDVAASPITVVLYVLSLGVFHLKEQTLISFCLCPKAKWQGLEGEFTLSTLSC